MKQGNIEQFFRNKHTEKYIELEKLNKERCSSIAERKALFKCAYWGSMADAIANPIKPILFIGFLALLTSPLSALLACIAMLMIDVFVGVIMR